MISSGSRRVSVFGGAGMLAREVGAVFAARDWSVELVSRTVCDIERASEVEAALASHRSSLIVNCAAYTDVERAESEPERAFAANAVGPATLARIAAQYGVPLLHLSTDYVFDGRSDRPYREDDPTNPLGVYAKSKEQGERAIRKQAGLKFWTVRTGELYGAGGRNFFTSIFRAARRGQELRVVDDQTVAPTWTRELALQLVELVCANAPSGTYHATAAGQVTWYDAAVFALTRAGFDCPVARVGTAEYGSKVPRPLFTVLAPQALERLGIYRMRTWDVALAEWIGASNERA